MTETEKNTKKIMIVDDDTFLLEMYSIKFKNSGFDVVACLGSEECLSKLKAGIDVDIFIFDLIMPKIDGVALIKEIKEKNYIPNATKVVLTNQGDQADIEKIKVFGIDGYIVKALHTPSEVVQKITEIHNKK